MRSSFIGVISSAMCVVYISCSVHGQYPPRRNYGNRDMPYRDYDRFAPWNPDRANINFLNTGMNSRYSDSRCRKGYRDLHMEEYLGSVTVQTRLGNIEGTYVYLCDGPGVPEFYRPKDDNINRYRIYRNLTVFLGIPYARPPTRENGLRFRPPQFHPSFALIRALEYKKACPQPPQYYGASKGVNETSEDCLYLNIFSPSVEKRSQKEKYPVMIYIHGGNWDHGSANVFPAQMLAASQEVVVVTFNYRLGPLGFFATADNSSAGNYGLLDQAMAIEWVYDNIEAFNGNPKLITLFGPDVGAASAGIHMLTERLGSKIKRIIAQSGSAVAEWAAVADPTIIYNNSAEFAKEARCYFPSTFMTVNCLRDLSISTLQVAHVEPKVGWSAWAPVIDAYTRQYDKQALPDLPEKLIKAAWFDTFDGYMTGVTKNNGLHMMLDDPYLQRNNYRITEEYFLKVIEKYASMYNYTLDPVSLTKAIQFLYVPCDENVKNITLMRQNYIDMLSDSYFKAPNDKMVKLLLQKGVKTYMYVLNSTAEGIKELKSRNFDIFNDTVPHDTEYYFVTGAPFMDPSLYPPEHKLHSVVWTEADRNMSQFFMTAWANFAKFGNPTPSALFESIIWKKTDLKTMQYLSVNTTNFTSVMLTGYRQKESLFWTEYIPDLMQLVTPTWPPFYQPWEIQRNVYEASLYGALAATVLCTVLLFLCCFLYCRAKSKHVVSTEDIPDAISTAPSSIDTLLNMKKLESRNRFLEAQMEAEQKHTEV